MKSENIFKMKRMNSEVAKYIDEMQEISKFTYNEIQMRALTLINKELSHITKNSPFYCKKHKAGLMPDHIFQLQDLKNIEFTTKDDLKNNYPFGFLAVPMSEVIRYGESTGTTGKHTSSFMTRQDWEENIARVTNALLNYYSKDDVVFIMIPYELSFSSFDLEKSFWNIGATVVSIGAKNSICPMERIADMLINLKPSSIVCSPTRAIRVYDLLKQKGYDPKDVNLKNIFYIGETCSNAKLDKIKQLWGVELVNIYGSSETNSLSLPCEFGKQHLTEDRFHFEIINPDTGDVIKDGNVGELVVTTLTHQAFPLIRYRTGDIIELCMEECNCGSKLRTIKHLGRGIDIIRVNDRKIRKLQIEECALSTKGTGCNLIHYFEDNEIVIAVEVVDCNESDVLRYVKQAVKDQLDLNVKVQTLDKEMVYKVMDQSLKPGSINWDVNDIGLCEQVK